MHVYRYISQLLDDPKEQGIYWELKEEALGCTIWRTPSGYRKNE
jgi:hypothetical protein